MELLINLFAVFIAALALIVAYLSWRASVQAVTATAYDRRYEIYADAEKFLSAWMRDARPDMDLLPLLVGAWSRSHFLCRQEVTDYLRKLWLDAVTATRMHGIMAGEEEGNHAEAVKKKRALFVEHADYAKLRNVFMPDLRVSTPKHIWQR